MAGDPIWTSNPEAEHAGISPSQISEERVEKVSDKLSEGDKQGRIRLSMKAVGE